MPPAPPQRDLTHVEEVGVKNVLRCLLWVVRMMLNASDRERDEGPMEQLRRVRLCC